eukprot:Protomagalhaensia_sp_Gyna_25__332@NODE_1156_length_2129_cov_269_281340_g389_i1_p2_GENE_NODE_1156_length_2129_cov_269_281340_g389_i1NODE_1156_length_2129_cov_269_281340_g389_i1_p2_ORF_typecomplete_len129_score2_66AMPbinding/PF00501_28/0_11_NODE_1156_length_2129_cov_269_281340_g389_i16541040
MKASRWVTYSQQSFLVSLFLTPSFASCQRCNDTPRNNRYTQATFKRDGISIPTERKRSSSRSHSRSHSRSDRPGLGTTSSPKCAALKQSSMNSNSRSFSAKSLDDGDVVMTDSVSPVSVKLVSGLLMD